MFNKGLLISKHLFQDEAMPGTNCPFQSTLLTNFKDSLLFSIKGLLHRTNLLRLCCHLMRMQFTRTFVRSSGKQPKNIPHNHQNKTFIKISIFCVGMQNMNTFINNSAVFSSLVVTVLLAKLDRKWTDRWSKHGVY